MYERAILDLPDGWYKTPWSTSTYMAVVDGRAEFGHTWPHSGHRHENRPTPEDEKYRRSLFEAVSNLDQDENCWYKPHYGNVGYVLSPEGFEFLCSFEPQLADIWTDDLVLEAA